MGLKHSLDRDGFVVVPSRLAPDVLDTLRTHCHKVTALARSGAWPNIRTLPKQFPPWSSDPSKGIWGVQNLMHPDLPGSNVFVSSYFDDATIETVRELLGGCGEVELVMELYNLLVRPDDDFELRWHRDDIAAAASAEEEMARLSKPAFHAQWNLALYDDASLIVVPQSHLRARSDAERAADPLEPKMPGQLVVKLRAGDMVFYNNNILHRGAYSRDVERMTLHGSIGHVKGGALRARNVLQHGQGEWQKQIDMSSVQKRQRAEGMRDRLVQLGTDNHDFGYSHDD